MKLACCDTSWFLVETKEVQKRKRYIYQCERCGEFWSSETLARAGDSGRDQIGGREISAKHWQKDWEIRYGRGGPTDTMDGE